MKELTKWRSQSVRQSSSCIWNVRWRSFSVDRWEGNELQTQWRQDRYGTYCDATGWRASRPAVHERIWSSAVYPAVFSLARGGPVVSPPRPSSDASPPPSHTLSSPRPLPLLLLLLPPLLLPHLPPLRRHLPPCDVGWLQRFLDPRPHPRNTHTHIHTHTHTHTYIVGRGCAVSRCRCWWIISRQFLLVTLRQDCVDSVARRQVCALRLPVNLSCFCTVLA